MTIQPGAGNGYPVPPVPPVVPAADLDGDVRDERNPNGDRDLAAERDLAADRDPDLRRDGVRGEPNENEPTLVTTPDHLEREVADSRPTDYADRDDRTLGDDRLLGDDRVVDLDGDER